MIGGSHNLVIAGTNSGDVIVRGGTVFVATTADNWLTNAAPKLYVRSASAVSSPLKVQLQEPSVFSPTVLTPTSLCLRPQFHNTHGCFRFVIQGVDLVATTVSGTSVALTPITSGSPGSTRWQQRHWSDCYLG